jgi:hypothetical protein
VNVIALLLAALVAVLGGAGASNSSQATMHTLDASSTAPSPTPIPHGPGGGERLPPDPPQHCPGGWYTTAGDQCVGTAV